MVKPVQRPRGPRGNHQRYQHLPWPADNPIPKPKPAWPDTRANAAEIAWWILGGVLFVVLCALSAAVA